MYMNCNLSANMTEGSEVKKIGNVDYDPLQALKECFAYLSSKGPDDGVLILTSLREWYSERKLRKDLKCKCKDEIGIFQRIAFVLLLQELGREEPLFHLQNFTSGRERIKMHMTNPKQKQDLVSDCTLAKGYESEKVVTINLTKQHLSRASIVGVDLDFDGKAFYKYGFSWIRTNTDHKCDKMPNLKSDPESS